LNEADRRIGNLKPKIEKAIASSNSMKAEEMKAEEQIIAILSNALDRL
jgi:hypothetical protein